LKFKPYTLLCTTQSCKDFIQTSKICSELLFRHCSCYSDTRGVTIRVLPVTVRVPPSTVRGATIDCTGRHQPYECRSRLSGYPGNRLGATADCSGATADCRGVATNRQGAAADCTCATATIEVSSLTIEVPL
jgi:hypothetical protein